MAKSVLTKRPLKRVIVTSIALAAMLPSVAQSSAACGGYCIARQTLAVCHRALMTNDLKTHERDAEFEKCKSDPLTYRMSPVEGGAQLGLD